MYIHILKLDRFTAQVINLYTKMPKKFAGENSKAVAARARKSEKAETERIKKEREKEDAEWMDNDKSLAKKQVSYAKNAKYTYIKKTEPDALAKY